MIEAATYVMETIKALKKISHTRMIARIEVQFPQSHEQECSNFI